MQVYRDFDNIGFDKKSVITVGTFDGVHLGHRKILKKVLELKNSKNLRSVVITFDPHPQIVLKNKSKDIKILSTTDEKIRLFDSFGIDAVCIINFTKEFSQTDAEDFYYNYLINKIGLSDIVIGYDHNFGRNREGKLETLKMLSQKYDFDFHKVDEYKFGSEVVSSTVIRHLLENQEVAHASKLLGSFYSIEGKVVIGAQLGMKIGFPTANINPSDEFKLIPKNGVYFVSSEINNEIYYGMMNIGYRPTVTDALKLIIEVHYLDFNLDIYNTIIRIDFIDFIRNEIKFNSIDDLKVQLEKDKKEITELIKYIK
jgi:riboflavin kinase/FMN adenylyltransferase